MAIDFPASPTLNDVFTVGNVTYVWDGTKWTASVTGGISLDKIEEGNTSAEVIDTGSDGRFVVTTEGTERLRVTNTGLVGMGTSNPGSRLEIGGDPSYDAKITFNRVPVQTSNDAVIGELFFQNNADSVALIAVKRESAADDAYIQFATQQTAGGLSERVRITSAGRVGIGTSSPSSALDVSGAISLGAVAIPSAGTARLFSRNTDSNLYIQTGGGNNLYLLDGSQNTMAGFGPSSVFLNTGNTTRLAIDSSGNVGIGTTAPTERLHIHSTGNNPAYLHSTNDGTGTGTTDGIIIGMGDATNAFLWNYENGGIVFATNATQRAAIDPSGRFLIGASSSPTIGQGQYAHLVVQGNTGNSTSSSVLSLQRGQASASVGADYYLGEIAFSGSDGGTFAGIVGACDGTAGSGDYPGRLVFSTTADGASSPTERMRISNGGYASFNTTSVIGSSRVSIAQDFVTGNGLGLKNTGAQTGGQYFVLFYNSSDVIAGSISHSGSTSVSFNTSSDYRLKENVTPVSDGITRLQQLKPSRFNFIADPAKTVDGFLAHEVQTIVPEAITGEKDAVDDEGNPEYQGIDQSKLVPLLTAALQEAIGRIETLEGMVAVNNITIDEQQHQLSTLAARLTALESA